MSKRRKKVKAPRDFVASKRLKARSRSGSLRTFARYLAREGDAEALAWLRNKGLSAAVPRAA